MVNATWYENGKGDNVKVLVCKDYETLSKKAAGILAGVINGKKAPVLGHSHACLDALLYKHRLHCHC